MNFVLWTRKHLEPFPHRTEGNKHVFSYLGTPAVTLTATPQHCLWSLSQQQQITVDLSLVLGRLPLAITPDSKPCCYWSLKSELTNCAPDRNSTVGHSGSFGERSKDIFAEDNKAPHTCPKSNRIPLCFQASFARLYCFQGKEKFERSLI